MLLIIEGHPGCTRYGSALSVPFLSVSLTFPLPLAREQVGKYYLLDQKTTCSRRLRDHSLGVVGVQMRQVVIRAVCHLLGGSFIVALIGVDGVEREERLIIGADIVGCQLEGTQGSGDGIPDGTFRTVLWGGTVPGLRLLRWSLKFLG